jgi:MFS family permease
VLLSWGYSLLQIGMLGGVVEALSYTFEVPSGILADRFGKKRELLLCFLFYIVSFVLYS